MKKYLMTALVLVASASLFTASAASKKKNVKKVTPVVLASEGDSLSYAARPSTLWSLSSKVLTTRSPNRRLS